MTRKPCKEGCVLCCSPKGFSVNPRDLRLSILSEKDPCNRFHCRNEGINEFISKEAMPFQKERLGVTYLFSSDNEIIGFVTLLMASIYREKLGIEDRLEIGKDRYPALQIGQLAVNVDYENNDVASYIVDWSVGKAIKVSEEIGCRFVILDAERDVVGFYERFEFQTLPKQEKQDRPRMFLNLYPRV